MLIIMVVWIKPFCSISNFQWLIRLIDIGGWVIGSLLSDQIWCKQACQSVGMIIVDVDYRLAPEFPFPAQVWDSWAALKWTFENAGRLGIDSSRVSIGGLSAGWSALSHLYRSDLKLGIGNLVL